jgi:hypothetical protein
MILLQTALLSLLVAGGARDALPNALKADASGGADQTVTRPDFSGRWAMINPDPSSSDIPPICALECVIAQDERTLSVKAPDGEARVTYRLDGVPVSSSREVLGRKVVTTVRAYWQDQAIVVERTTGSGERDEARHPVVTTMALEGDRLIFTRVWPGTGRGSTPVRFAYERLLRED